MSKMRPFGTYLSHVGFERKSTFRVQLSAMYKEMLYQFLLVVMTLMLEVEQLFVYYFLPLIVACWKKMALVNF